MQHRPLELDFDSSAFQRLSRKFQSQLHPDQNLDEVVANLDEVVQSAMQSDSADENITRMSQVIRKGPKCLRWQMISAGLLKASHLKTGAQLIYGA